MPWWKTACPFPGRSVRRNRESFPPPCPGAPRKAYSSRLGVKYHFFCIFHFVLYWFIMLSSHSSVIGLFLALAGEACPCHALRVRVRKTPALLPMSIMPRKAPAILPNHPKRPKMRKAAAIRPAMLNPDTLPWPRLRTKLPSMFMPPPLEACRRKWIPRQVWNLFRLRLRLTCRRLSGLVRQSPYIFGGICQGIRGRFSDDRIAHDTHHALVCRRLFPADITDRTSDGGNLDGLSGARNVCDG